MNLSNKSYKGTRDYYPEDKRVQNYIFETWRRVVESFGYEEYGAPILEPLELYAAKSGADLVNDETYRFVDRGDREVAIRPEMTPTVARMIAARQQETPFPARWYSIANFMRYERPQNGREREFWQLNVDMFGVDGAEADSEMIILADSILKAFGATPKMYSIKINHRKLIDYMMREYLALDAVQTQLMTKLFDKKNKITPEDFRAKAIEILEVDKVDEGLKKIAGLFAAKTIKELPKQIRDNEIFTDLTKLFETLRENGVNNAQFDVGLMRGLDYYNGVVFEVFDNHPENNRAMFGGGRYDGMTTLFGAENIPVIGFAPGSTTTELFLRAHDLLPALTSRTELYAIAMGEVLDQVKVLVSDLRTEGVRVELDITSRKLEKQIKTATKKSITHVLFVGEEELQTRQYTLKNLQTGSEQKLSFERLVSVMKDRRHSS
jgi:histidyl-tRNA synthetase